MVEFLCEGLGPIPKQKSRIRKETREEKERRREERGKERKKCIMEIRVVAGTCNFST